MSKDILGQVGPAEPVASRCKLGEEARALLRPGMSCRAYLEALMAAGHLLDAIRLLGWALPRREAVWWASVCVRAGLTEAAPPAERAALAAAEKWAAAPTEPNRYAAEAAAAAVEYGTPGGFVAMAAFWACGSMAPPKLTVVAPPIHLLPEAVANSLVLAAHAREPEKAAEKYRRFLALALEVSEGKSRWAEEKPAGVAARPAGAPPAKR